MMTVNKEVYVGNLNAYQESYQAGYQRGIEAGIKQEQERIAKLLFNREMI